MKKIKEIKIVNQDQSTEVANIGADAINVDYNDTTVKAELDKWNTDNNPLALKLNKKPYYYDNVADMKADTTLKAGDMAITLGYYEANDGGEGLYKIVNDNTLVDDGGSIHSLTNGLKATLIVENNTISVKQFGAKGDGTTDDINSFNSAINYVDGKYMNLYINSGKYKLTDSLTIPWNTPNMWTQPFTGSYSLKGAGMFETILNFSGKDGVLFQRESGGLSIDICDFSIQNTSFNPNTQIGNERTPDISKGVGLLYDGGGYTSHLSRIGVKGFYIGLATRHCYGGPLIENVFTYGNIFGYSSKEDTSVQHSSCNYHGLEACYIQEGGVSTLSNIVCEGNFDYFVDNNHNERDKFEGRGFVFINSRINGLGLWTEALWGNARYIEDSHIVELNPVPNNFMHYKMGKSEYADIKTWLDEHDHNYDDIYVTQTKTSGTYVHYINGNYSSACYANVNSSTQNTTKNALMSSVIFEGVTTYQGPDATFERFYQGNSKPIVITDILSSISRRSNFDYFPHDYIGKALFTNNEYREHYDGVPSLTTGRETDSFSNTDYNRVDLEITHDLGGNIHIFRKTSLNGVQVDRTEVIKISNSNQVTFPSNTN